MSPPPMPKLAFEGAVTGNPRAVCHQYIQEGVKDYREDEKDVSQNLFNFLGKSSIFTGMMIRIKLCGFSVGCWWVLFSTTFSHVT